MLFVLPFPCTDQYSAFNRDFHVMSTGLEPAQFSQLKDFYSTSEDEQVIYW